MGGETEKQVSGWTVDTLKEHIDRALAERDLRYEQRFQHQEKAVADAKGNADKWQANANEWRDAMNDRERSFARKPEVELVTKMLDELKERFDKSEARKLGAAAVWATVISVVAIIAGSIGFFASR